MLVAQRFEKYIGLNMKRQIPKWRHLDNEHAQTERNIAAEIMSKSHCFERMQIRILDVFCLSLEL
jgi:hypothetical protein